MIVCNMAPTLRNRQSQQQQQQQQQEEQPQSQTPPPITLDNEFMCNRQERFYIDQRAPLKKLRIVQKFTCHAQLGTYTSTRTVRIIVDEINDTITFDQECISEWEDDKYFHPHQVFLGPFSLEKIEFS